jgi:hypothetical protein
MLIYLSFLKRLRLGSNRPPVQAGARGVFGGGKWNFLLTKTLLAIVWRQ